MQLEQAATTNDTTSQDGDHVISMHYAIINNTLTSNGRSDLDKLLQLVVIIDYNTHWLITCVDGEHIPLHDAVRYVVPILCNESDPTHTTHNVLSLENDNLYHKDNTQHECGIDRSMHKCKNIGIVTVV